MTDSEQTRPATDKVAAETADDEIRDPVTGEPDGYVLLPGDTTVSLPARPDETTAETIQAQVVAEPAAETGEFPLWPTAAPTPPAPARPAPSPIPRRPRRTGVGLPLLVVLGLAAAFFAWVGAEPFWLAVGHADRGALVVTDCTGHGITLRCTGDFTATGYAVKDVTVTGVKTRPGAHLDARMVGPSSRTAYAGDEVGLLLRWAVPAGLIVLIALLVPAFTGAWRLRGRYRFGAVTLSLVSPLLLAAGITAVAA